MRARVVIESARLFRACVCVLREKRAYSRTTTNRRPPDNSRDARAGVPMAVLAVSSQVVAELSYALVVADADGRITAALRCNCSVDV